MFRKFLLKLALGVIRTTPTVELTLFWHKQTVWLAGNKHVLIATW